MGSDKLVHMISKDFATQVLSATAFEDLRIGLRGTTFSMLGIIG